MKKAIRRRVDLKLVHFFAYRSWARGYRSIKFLNSSEVPTKPMGRDPVVPPTPAKSVLSLRPFMWNSNHIHIYMHLIVKQFWLFSAATWATCLR